MIELNESNGPSEAAMERVLAEYVVERGTDEEGEEIAKKTLDGFDCSLRFCAAWEAGDLDLAKAWLVATQREAEVAVGRLIENASSAAEAISAAVHGANAMKLIEALKVMIVKGDPKLGKLVPKMKAKALAAKALADAMTAASERGATPAPGSSTAH